MKRGKTLKQISLLLVSGKKDDYDTIQGLFSHLKSDRFCIDWAVSFEAAQRALNKNHYAVALVEDDLETMKGSQFILKTEQKGIELPIILFAKGDNWQGDEAAFQSDAIYCLDRDKMTPEKLEDIILKVLDLRRISAFLKVHPTFAGS